MQYYTTVWFTDTITVLIIGSTRQALQATPVFSGLGSAQNLGVPNFGRYRNLTTASPWYEFGQGSPPFYP